MHVQKYFDCHTLNNRNCFIKHIHLTKFNFNQGEYLKLFASDATDK
jgi:hypothetical protein